VWNNITMCHCSSYGVFTVMRGRDTDFVSCRNYHILEYSGLFVARVCMGGGLVERFYGCLLLVGVLKMAF